MLNTLIGKAKFGGVGGTGGIKYFKFVLLGGDGKNTNYGVGGRGGGGLLEYIVSSDTMTSEVTLEARVVGGGRAGTDSPARGGSGYYLTTLIGIPSGPGPGTWVGGPDSVPLKPSIIAAVGGGGGEGRADNLPNIEDNVEPQIPWSNFTGPIGGGHGFGSGAPGKPGRGGAGAGGGASTSSGGTGAASPQIGGQSSWPGSPGGPHPNDTGSNGSFLRAGRGNMPNFLGGGSGGSGNHGGGGGGGYYGGGAGGTASGPNDAHYGGGGGGGSGFADTSYPNYYSQVSSLGGKSKYIDLSFPATDAGGSGGIFLTSAPIEQINANTVTYTQVFTSPGTKEITLKLDGTFTIE